MKFLTGYFCCANSHSALVLQQVTRRQGNLPIVFAFVETDFQCGSDCGSFAREMTEWFYEKVLPGCAKGSGADCVDAVLKMFKNEAAGIKGDFAALFAAGRECFYAWRGTVQIQLLNLCFNKFHCKVLTRLSEALCVERACIEADVGLLLGTADFFAHLPESLLKECLDVAKLQSSERAQRHLREVAEEAVRRGAKNPAVVLVVAERSESDGG